MLQTAEIPFPVAVIEIPTDLVLRKLPNAVQARLQFLLDRQDSGIDLTLEERDEAEGLVSLAEFLTLLNLRAKRMVYQS